MKIIYLIHVKIKSYENESDIGLKPRIIGTYSPCVYAVNHFPLPSDVPGANYAVTIAST